MPSSSYFTTTLNHPPLSFSTPPLPTCSRRGISTNTFAASTPNPTARRCSRSSRAPLRPVAALPANSAASATPSEQVKEGVSLPPPLRPEALPSHVAIIMDGNSRWARARGLPAAAGHQEGYRAIKKIVDVSRRWGIRALTVFAFSSENWTRPKVEVDFLMMLFESVLKQRITDYVNDGIRVSVIGDSSRLPQSLQRLIKEVTEMQMTKNNTQLDVIVAIGYSGRRDITQACRSIMQKVQNGFLQPEDITESHIAQELETNRILECPYPDLLIRTSGELRLSNFLLWQSAYTELFFTETYWPDFDEANYVEALLSFQNRQRRFGQRVN